MVATKRSSPMPGLVFHGPDSANRLHEETAEAALTHGWRKADFHTKLLPLDF